MENNDVVVPTKFTGLIGYSLEKGERKENQDELFIVPYPEDTESKTENGALLLSVLDGHGTSGRTCAVLTKRLLLKEFENYDSKLMEAFFRLDNEQIQSEFTRLFNQTQTELETMCQDKANKCNARFSGTTLSVAIASPTCLVVANVGDSDVVLGSCQDGASSIQATQLSVKHQPVFEEEKNRIISAGGRVGPQQTRDGKPMNGPLRVWMQDVQTPGLMVSRSIGDSVCHEIGVIADPSVTIHQVTPNDKVLILASDGLWEFVSYEEAVGFTEDFIDAQRASHGLTVMSLSKQNIKNADNVCVIVCFLENEEDRKRRLESRSDFMSAHENREKEIAEYEKIIDSAQEEVPANKMIPLDDGSPATGSIIYGGDTPAAGSIVDTGSEYENQKKEGKERDQEGTPSKASASKACVIC